MIISYKRLKETAWVLSPVSHTPHIGQCRGGGRRGKMRKERERGGRQADSDGVKRDGG